MVERKSGGLGFMRHSLSTVRVPDMELHCETLCDTLLAHAKFFGAKEPTSRMGGSHCPSG